MPAEPFELPLEILAEDIDELGHVNNVTYVRWVQDAAAAHWRHAASAEAQVRFAWVVVRHEVDYLKRTLPGDAVLARTWVGPATRLKYERHTEILRAADRAVLARARSVWCPIDAATGAPTPLTPEVRAAFST